jgi:hypothetical protein
MMAAMRWGAPLLVACALALGVAVVDAEPRPATGALRVSCDVPANAYVDGVAAGGTPADLANVREGEHVVEVRAARYSPASRRVFVKAGETTTVRFALREVGRLRVLSHPAGATVLFNGVGVGKTPLDEEVEAGEIVVRIYIPGLVSYEQTIDVEAGKAYTISRELVPRP